MKRTNQVQNAPLITEALTMSVQLDLNPAILPNHAILPGWPANTNDDGPQWSGDAPIADDTLWETLGDLHLVAFIAAYGCPPPGVTIKSICDEANGPGWKAYVSEQEIDGRSRAIQIDYVETFRAGLDRWNDGGFINPLFRKADEEGQPWHIDDAKTATYRAIRALCRQERFSAMRNLQAWLGKAYPNDWSPDYREQLSLRKRP